MRTAHITTNSRDLLGAGNKGEKSWLPMELFWQVRKQMRMEMNFGCIRMKMYLLMLWDTRIKGTSGLEQVMNSQLLTSHANVAEQVQKEFQNEKNVGDCLHNTGYKNYNRQHMMRWTIEKVQLW